jgi:hypothetical protein
MANSEEDYSFDDERKSHIIKQQTKPTGKRGYYKTPVHETNLPTIEMTRNSNIHVPLEGAERKTSINGQKENTKTNEPQGALLTVKQPRSFKESLSVKNSDIHNSIHEAEETKISTGGTKTIIEKQDMTMTQSEPQPQDKAAESLPSTMPPGQVEKRVGQDVVKEPLERMGLDDKSGGQEELPVYDTGVNRLDRIDLSSSGDYPYPFIITMALWQDFALSAIHMYKECAREISRFNGNWMNIFSSVWRESSNTDKENENE